MAEKKLSLQQENDLSRAITMARAGLDKVEIFAFIPQKYKEQLIYLRDQLNCILGEE
jgi:hypothetical protein